MNESRQPRSLSFDMGALGRPQAWAVRHRGLEYRGEVIIAESVDPAWGEPLPGGLSFRLVFFTVPRRIPPSRILDTRIAMAVPGRSPSQARQTLRQELRTLQETSEYYVTAHDPDTLALRHSIPEREASLREDMERRYGMAYTQGRIYTHPDIRLRVRDVFVQNRLESWANRLAGSVLLLAHPGLPFDYAAFPHPLDTETALALYRGLFQGDGAAARIVRGFGPGLGVTLTDAPMAFDASGCPVVAIIKSRLVMAGGEMPAGDIIHSLEYSYGLTQALALFYLMAFVRQTRAEVQFQPGHRIQRRGGGLFLSDRITWDMISEVAFSESLIAHLGALRLQLPPVWNTVLPYAALLVGGLEASDEGAVIAWQERGLLNALDDMAPGIVAARDAIDTLEASLGARPLGASVALDRLLRLVSVSSHHEFYSMAQESFQSPSSLADALEVYGRVQRLAEVIPAIARAADYLDQMAFRQAQNGQEYQDLLLERDSVAARLDPDGLVSNPSLWTGIEASFQGLQERYARAYRAHHTRYHQEALELRHRLERLQPQVDALARFNEIPELGDPVGVEAQQRFKDVSYSYVVCSASEDALDLSDVPYCQSCLLSLDMGIPRRDVEILLGAVWRYCLALERAMREYNRRLSSHSVRQILAHPSQEQLDRFISLVQAADPSTLADVLDGGVVAFLRGFLRE